MPVKVYQNDIQLHQVMCTWIIPANNNDIIISIVVFVMVYKLDLHINNGYADF